MKKISVVLIIEALALIILNLFGAALTGGGLRILTYPFEKFGELLRYMSLQSDEGNIAALAIYVVIGLIPVVILLVKSFRKKFCIEDMLLIVVSAAYYIMAYIMINPLTYLNIYRDGEQLILAKIIVCVAMYSVILSYIVIKIIRKMSLKNQSQDKLKRYLITGLWLMAVIIVYTVFYSSLDVVIDSISGLDKNFYEVESYKLIDIIVLIIGYIVEVIPNIGNVIIIVAIATFIGNLNMDSVSETLVTESKKLAYICKINIICTVVTNALYNMIVLIFAGKISHLQGNISFPIFSIVITIVIMILANSINDYKNIKEENDMFI